MVHLLNWKKIIIKKNLLHFIWRPSHISIVYGHRYYFYYALENFISCAATLCLWSQNEMTVLALQRAVVHCRHSTGKAILILFFFWSFRKIKNGFFCVVLPQFAEFYGSFVNITSCTRVPLSGQSDAKINKPQIRFCTTNRIPKWRWL